MSALIWLVFLALQNGTQDPVVTREFELSLTPNVCARNEETLGSIELYKTCGHENLSVSVAPGRADQVIVKVFYWNSERPTQLLSKKMSLTVPSGQALVTTDALPILPTWVKAIEITMMRNGKKVERRKATYSLRPGDRTPSVLQPCGLRPNLNPRT
jgi:hypothetical protein